MKQLTRFQYANVKRTAKANSLNVRKLLKLQEVINEKAEEAKVIKEAIDSWETPIIAMTGYTSSQILRWGGQIPENEEELNQLNAAAESGAVVSEEVEND